MASLDGEPGISNVANGKDVASSVSLSDLFASLNTMSVEWFNTYF